MAISEEKFAELTVRLFRLHQRFDAQPEAREEIRTEITQVLKQLEPGRGR